MKKWIARSWSSSLNSTSSSSSTGSTPTSPRTNIDGMQDIEKVEPSDLDERLLENMFIDFFTDFDGDDMSARQFTQLQPRLPEDVDLLPVKG